MTREDCEECKGKGWKYICSNCGNDIEYSYIADADFFDEYCPRCRVLQEDYSIIQADCPSCTSSKKNSNSEYSGISFDTLISETMIRLSFHYGRPKIDQIYQKVINSSNVHKTLYNLIHINELPSVTGIHQVLGSNFYFSLGKKYKLIIGGLFFIQLWNINCNKDHRIASEEVVIKFSEYYMDETKKLL